MKPLPQKLTPIPQKAERKRSISMREIPNLPLVPPNAGGDGGFISKVTGWFKF